MKKYLLLMLTSFLLGCATSSEPEKTGNEGKDLPKFDVQLNETWIYHSSEIPTGQPIVLLYFRTYCPFCKEEIEDILDELESMKDLQFYFISPDSLSEIRKFGAKFNLFSYDNIKVGRDVNLIFKNYFKTPGAPYTAIYGKNKKLNAAFFGKVGPSEIKKYVKL